ncbi:hypothetical protein HOA91_06970 [Candidatus Woesearchaeota archaeon]|jgi:hypothetical protein|nr:hypothetical protein [Candidatus Woesearchaeota archaeon]
MDLDYLTKKLYIPIMALSLAIGTPSCSLGAKDIDDAYQFCLDKDNYYKVRTTEGKLTCEEIDYLFESQ